ncbi:MAG: DNA polymerase III subunit delta [Dehalococcoidia bacterium]
MPVHVLYGDSFLVSEELKKLQAEASADALLEANQHRMTGSQAKLPELLSILNALPFLDVRRLVVVEGLLTLLEGRGNRRGRGRAASTASSNSLGEWEGLASALPQMPDTTLLFLVDGAISDANPLLRALQPVALVHKLVAPNGEALARWIKTQAQEKGAGISPAAINSLADLVGNDLWVLDRELEKLSLYAHGRNIEEEDVRELVSQVREANVFNMVDAMIEGRAAVALPLLQQIRQDGREAPYIIGMVERQLRLLALARELMEQRVPQGEMGTRLGVNSQFVLRKTLEQARRHSWDNITWCYQRLLAADLSIKRGRLEPDLALELLVADLASPLRG